MLRTLASTNVVFFYSGWIRTLVAMATYISHRLIMGKVEIDIFFCLIGPKKKICVFPVTRPTLIFPSDPKVFIGIPKK